MHQVGDNGDFMPANQTRTEGNDDQSFWAFTALMAAEMNFPNPEDDKPSWLSLAQAVFNEQAARWDEDTCNGGLKWQIYSFNSGYQYKNSISNGCFFDLGARLARYTGNTTYAEWAERTWDWAIKVGVIGERYEVYDGTSETNNCSDVNHVQWSYNNGVFLHGAAHMWNYVCFLTSTALKETFITNKTQTNGASTWGDRVQSLLNAQQIFFSHNTSSSHVMYESSCEPENKCTTDQTSFKAYLGRWMADIAKIAPFTYDTIIERLRASATAAAAQCSGGDTGTYCGTLWTTGSYDGSMGVGQQLSALEVVQVTLLDTIAGPITDDTGGSSKGDSSAGTSDSAHIPHRLGPVTKKDRVGAGVVTGVFVCLLIGCGVFMLF